MLACVHVHVCNYSFKHSGSCGPKFQISMPLALNKVELERTPELQSESCVKATGLESMLVYERVNLPCNVERTGVA